MLDPMKAAISMKKVFGGVALAFCALELGARIIIPASLVRQISVPYMFQSDSHLGYRLRPDMETHVHAWDGKKNLFHAVYRTDQFGRRYVHVENPTSRDQHFVILGGSTAYGMGLNDKDTLASFLARENPRWMPYNYAGDGYGPQSAYAFAHSGELKKNIPQEEGFTVFFFQMINHTGGHPQTLLGRFELFLDGWGESLPLYKIESGKAPEPIGFMKDHAPVKFQTFRFLQLFHFLNLIYPHLFPLTSDELQKTADFMASLREEVLQHQPKTHFLVVIHPLSDRTQTHEIVARMRASGTEVLDLSNLIPENELKDHIAFHRHFPHPNGKLNEKIARRLVEYFKTGQ